MGVRRFGKSLVYSLRRGFAVLVSYAWVLTISMIGLAIGGASLQFGPIARMVVLLFAGPFFIAVLGLILEGVISVVIEFRGAIARWWRLNTPPYIPPENSLPVTDISTNTAYRVGVSYLKRFAVVYAVCIILAVWVAFEQPNILNTELNSRVTSVTTYVLFGILQIPTILLESSFLHRYVPLPEGRLNSVVFILLFIIPVPWMAIAVTNFRRILELRKNRTYWRIFDHVIYDKSENIGFLSIALIFDMLAVLFMLGIAYELAIGF